MHACIFRSRYGLNCERTARLSARTEKDLLPLIIPTNTIQRLTCVLATDRYINETTDGRAVIF